MRCRKGRSGSSHLTLKSVLALYRGNKCRAGCYGPPLKIYATRCCYSSLLLERHQHRHSCTCTRTCAHAHAHIHMHTHSFTCRVSSVSGNQRPPYKHVPCLAKRPPPAQLENLRFYGVIFAIPAYSKENEILPSALFWLTTRPYQPPASGAPYSSSRPMIAATLTQRPHGGPTATARLNLGAVV